MPSSRSTGLFIRIAILILLVCLGVLFLAASIMNTLYSTNDNSAVHRTSLVCVDDLGA